MIAINYFSVKESSKVKKRKCSRDKFYVERCSMDKMGVSYDTNFT